MDTIRNFNRFELKYLITRKEAEHFKKSLLPYLKLDHYGGNDGKYSLSSLYYDSPNLRCYWEKEYGIRFRRKLRIRRYEDGSLLTEDSTVFVEIKQRVDRVTQKRRLILPYYQALQLCNDRQIPEGTQEDQALIEEIYVFLWQYNLRPVGIVHYDRHAFMGTQYDPGLRITFDTNLRFQTQSTHLHESPNGLPIFPANFVVMEIKVNDRIPFWLTGLIADHGLQLERMSKYCRGIEAAQKSPFLRKRFFSSEDSRDILETIPGVYQPVAIRM